MLAKVFSAAVYGVEAFEVEIEVNGARGEPKIIIVGLPDAAVKESRDRVTTAISNSGFYWPRGRTTINLAPADIKKEGPSFDLPIALAMIACAQDVKLDHAADFCFVGELALDGAVRPVRVGVEDAFVSMVRSDSGSEPSKRSSKRPTGEANAQ